MALDTLNEFLPKDTDPVSLGDDAIRETRAATKQSVGLEHYLNGYHKIPGGTVAARPPAGNVGRLYYNGDRHQLEFDEGAQWSAPDRTRATAGAISTTGPPTYYVSSSNLQEVQMKAVWKDSAVPSLVFPQWNQVHGPLYDCWGIVNVDIKLDVPSYGFGNKIVLETYVGAEWFPAMSQYSKEYDVFHICTLAVMVADQPWRVTYLNATGVNVAISRALLSIIALGAG